MAERTNPILVQWYHPTLFSPVKQTIFQAIKKGYFATWPNLTNGLINNHLPPSMTTAKGHMHQKINNLKSTKPQEPKTLEDQPMKPLLQRTNPVFTKINHKRQISTNLTGKLPVKSNRGNKYIFVLYDYDSNCILIRPMKSGADSRFIRFFTDLHEHLLDRGLKPAYMILENEDSPAFQRELKAKNIDFQLVPPVMNCRNAA